MQTNNSKMPNWCSGRSVWAALGLAMVVVAGSGPANADPIKISVSAVGRPPIMSNTFIDVAQAQGYFKDAGLDENMRWFQQSADTAKAVLTGDADVSWTGSVVGLNLSAAGAPVVAIAGMEVQDWIVASDDPSVKGCADLKGQTVAADGINNARYLYLGAVAATCGVKLADMHPINLANAALIKAGIAHQVHTAVFHADEFAQVAAKSGTTWFKIPAPASIAKILPYGTILTSKKEIAENREGLVRFLEVWIRTQRFMASTKPADQAAFAAVVAKASNMDPAVAESAIKYLQSIGYWVDDLGLDQAQMKNQLEQLELIGTIKASNAPTYENLVDPSLYAEAVKRLAGS